MLPSLVLCLLCSIAKLVDSSQDSHVHDLGRSLTRECTIIVRSDLRLDGGPDTFFECILDQDDANRAQATNLSINLSDSQKLIMEAKLASGELVSNLSTLTIDASTDLSRSQAINISLGQIEFELETSKVQRAPTTVTGPKPILVVKVTDSEGRARPESSRQISDDIFGSFGDKITLKSQMHACSFGKLDITAGLPSGTDTSSDSPGVVDITIGISLLNNSRFAIRKAMADTLEAQLGYKLPGPYQHVMFVLEGCYQECGWAAYAYVNSWMSVYQGEYYKHVGVQMHGKTKDTIYIVLVLRLISHCSSYRHLTHNMNTFIYKYTYIHTYIIITEIGHNFNFLHSGGIDGLTYTDHTGLMGNPLYSDDIGKMCWNAAKSWQIGWYDNSTIAINPRQGSWVGKIIGVADFANNPLNHPVIVKVETGSAIDQYITLNRAKGINIHNDEADDEVTIVETSGNGVKAAQSYLKAHLVEGESYTYPDWAGSGQSLIVKVNQINLDVGANTADYAEVEICLGTCAARICEDSEVLFDITNKFGVQKRKGCDWVRKNWTGYRCKNYSGAKDHCAKTCTNCCKDSNEPFLLHNGKERSCEWAAKDVAERCPKQPTRLKCPVTCGECDA